MIRRSSFGRRLGWMILLAVCFLPVALRAEAMAPSTAGSPEPAITGVADAPSDPVHRLTAIEATPGQDDVRVFLATGGSTSVKPFMLASPHRLVLDLPGVANATQKSRMTIDNPLIDKIRVGERRDDGSPVTRVVLDLKQACAFKVVPADGGVLVTVTNGHSADSAAETTAANANANGGENVQAETDSAPEAPAMNTEAAAIPEPAAIPSEMAMAAAPEAPSPNSPEAAPPAAQGASAPRDDAAYPPAANGAQQAPPAPLVKGGAILAPALTEDVAQGTDYQMKTLTPEAHVFTGKKISLNLVDADVKQVFRLFHEISGLNFVLDPGVAGNVTVVLDEVPWDQALDLILKNNGLDKVYENNVIRIATTQKLASELSSRKALKDAKELEADVVGITRRLSYAKAKDIESIIKTGALLSARGKSYYDDRTNTLIIADVPTRVMPLDKLITDLDAKTPQVMIEARMVITARSFLRDIGIRWGFDYTPTGSSSWNFPNHGFGFGNVNAPPASTAGTIGFDISNASGTFRLLLALDALENEGKSRVLSAPRIATQNNVKAEIEQGIQIPIAQTTSINSTITFVSATLKLTVTPQITAEDTVIMDIEVENNSLNQTFTAQEGIPAVDVQRAQTKVMVEDGGTTVIGGIFTVSDAKTETGIPWLRSIPIFGWLFKNQHVSIENRELMIFLTPKILRSS